MIDIRAEMIRFLILLSPFLAGFSGITAGWYLATGDVTNGAAAVFALVFWVGAFLLRDRVEEFIS